MAEQKTARRSLSPTSGVTNLARKALVSLMADSAIFIELWSLSKSYVFVSVHTTETNVSVFRLSICLHANRYLNTSTKKICGYIPVLSSIFIMCLTGLLQIWICVFVCVLYLNKIFTLFLFYFYQIVERRTIKVKMVYGSNRETRFPVLLPCAFKHAYCNFLTP